MPRYNPEQPIGAKKGGLKPFKAHFTEHDGEHEYHSDGLVWARTGEAADNKCRRLMSQWWGENDMKPCRDASGKVDPDSFEDYQSGRIVELGAVRELVTLGDLVQCIGVIE
ncbi:MAG: hypothetical protein WC455_22795 [Dehalococcoidia bacterium]|jgi:hypothetical protein